jgi:predicted dehydrogenase
MVSARLQFANGAVANLTASRTSYAPARSMQVYTAERFASIDFGARKATIVEPRADIIDRGFALGGLSDDQRTRYRERLFEELLVKSEVPSVESNAIEQELVDFAMAIRTGRAPRVTGADGRDAVAVAEMVLERVRAHQWDGAGSRRVGPLASPTMPIAAAALPDDAWSAEDTVILRRKAG